MSASTMENGKKPPKRKKTLLRSCLALLAGIGIALFLFWLIFFLFIGPDLVHKSIEAAGYSFFKDMKSSMMQLITRLLLLTIW